MLFQWKRTNTAFDATTLNGNDVKYMTSRIKNMFGCLQVSLLEAKYENQIYMTFLLSYLLLAPCTLAKKENTLVVRRTHKSITKEMFISGGKKNLKKEKGLSGSSRFVSKESRLYSR